MSSALFKWRSIEKGKCPTARGGTLAIRKHSMLLHLDRPALKSQYRVRLALFWQKEITGPRLQLSLSRKLQARSLSQDGRSQFKQWHAQSL